ncbi:hypothetical protein CRM22_009426 [Opisthorchis felineus]|uniref:PPM-type phosphatase domain-containing protein n=1 Tax=Opisthorchis felineus TaxID=147828 RepID=A0A4S2L7L9_OPIFE|nr:hypothetical protein CRM22_009426 [Opisthorchis felineus]
MVGDSSMLIARRLLALRIHRILCRLYRNGSFGDFDHLSGPRVPETEVNKRLTERELNYAAPHDRLILSANQVGVNRPVEDRWIAFQSGPFTSEGSRLSSLDLEYGGYMFSVFDGHGGPACAHAINLLHPDYLVAGLLPPGINEQVLLDLRSIEEPVTTFSVCGLSDALWSRPETTVTGESEHIKYQNLIKPPVAHNSCQWPPWGPWGPLPGSIHDLHVANMRKLLVESLSCSLADDDSYLDHNDYGDICDPEGFTIASFRSIQDAIISARHELSMQYAADVEAIDMLGPEVNRLYDRIVEVSRNLRNSFKRLDIDLSHAAQPSQHSATLDKALLRIVFSGCVATTAFIPNNCRELYVAQVGDCGAVLGSLVSGSAQANRPPRDHRSTVLLEYSSSDWRADLLIEPHNAENAADVQRLRSSHPVHESAFVIRDDRLLGELMPLRAFGDIRFKWPSEELKHVARLLDLPPNYPIMPAFYTTPPYLSSTPQVVWRPLVPSRDYFLILATDGLWDMISPKEAVDVVARHWFDYRCYPSICGPGDTAATRLIRTALGGDTMDPQRISVHFSMPATVARYYRDDITVLVVYLPTAFRESHFLS